MRKGGAIHTGNGGRCPSTGGCKNQFLDLKGGTFGGHRAESIKGHGTSICVVIPHQGIGGMGGGNGDRTIPREAWCAIGGKHHEVKVKSKVLGLAWKSMDRKENLSGVIGGCTGGISNGRKGKRTQFSIDRPIERLDGIALRNHTDLPRAPNDVRGTERYFQRSLIVDGHVRGTTNNGRSIPSGEAFDRQ